jgi:hypothetical protein
MHNSALNADFLAAYNDGNQKQMLHALFTDYEINYRQFVVYVVNCDDFDCTDGLIPTLREMVMNVDLPMPFTLMGQRPQVNPKGEYHTGIQSAIESIILQ